MVPPGTGQTRPPELGLCEGLTGWFTRSCSLRQSGVAAQRRRDEDGDWKSGSAISQRDSGRVNLASPCLSFLAWKVGIIRAACQGVWGRTEQI